MQLQARPALAVALLLALSAPPPARSLEPRAPAAPLFPIDAIQGAAHASPLEGEQVTTVGIVTAVDSNGFYLQGGDADDDPASSSGLFVFTGLVPPVFVGDEIQVTGTVAEFVAGGTASENLPITELVDPSIDAVFAERLPLPFATVVGEGGRLPPSELIDDDGFSVFDPEDDGIDFYESLEGMRVRLPEAVAVAPMLSFSEFWVVVDDGRAATGRSRRGSLVLREDDPNPERIQVQLDADLLPGAPSPRAVADRLGDVVGVVSYGFGSFEVRPTELFAVEAGGLGPETTTLERGDQQLLLASFNVENLDPGDGERFDALAAQIVEGLGAPDLLALQEVQDDDGAENTGNVEADGTWRALVRAVEDAGGPHYEWVDRSPENGRDGGQPGGNIRVGYLFDPTRVELVPGSVERLLDRDPADGDVFSRSRKPLAAEFRFGGETLLLVNLHLTSRGGGSPLFGATQPPEVGGADRRLEQAAEVRAQLEARVADRPDLHVVVLGDMNEFPFAEPLLALEGGDTPPRLTNLAQLLPEEERYSFVFQGNAQQLDHVLVSPGVLPGAAIDIVHRNAEFRDNASDHDPVLVRLLVSEPGELLQGLGAMALCAGLARTCAGREPGG
ncbi:MAG: endonuclease/exonuclease/phosphatase family protein [Myxococcota bacterium]